MEIQVITNRCFGLFMRRNVSISRNRTKIERLLDWKEFPSKSVGRFSFQCLTVKKKLLVYMLRFKENFQDLYNWCIFIFFLLRIKDFTT